MIEFISLNWGELLVGLMAFAKVIVNLTPTENDNKMDASSAVAFLTGANDDDDEDMDMDDGEGTAKSVSNTRKTSSNDTAADAEDYDFGGM